jgi:hypothetical protein
VSLFDVTVRIKSVFRHNQTVDMVCMSLFCVIVRIKNAFRHNQTVGRFN